MDKALKAMVEGMEMLDSELRIKLLEEIGRLHGISLTLFALLESQEHTGHADDCPVKYPKFVVDGYMEAFSKDVYSSIQLTCEVNGIEYTADPNKKVRDEILNSCDS